VACEAIGRARAPRSGANRERRRVMITGVRQRQNSAKKGRDRAHGARSIADCLHLTATSGATGVDGATPGRLWCGPSHFGLVQGAGDQRKRMCSFMAKANLACASGWRKFLLLGEWGSESGKWPLLSAR